MGGEDMESVINHDINGETADHATSHVNPLFEGNENVNPNLGQEVISNRPENITLNQTKKLGCGEKPAMEFSNNRREGKAQAYNVSTGGNGGSSSCSTIGQKERTQLVRKGDRCFNTEWRTLEASLWVRIIRSHGF